MFKFGFKKKLKPNKEKKKGDKDTPKENTNGVKLLGYKSIDTEFTVLPPVEDNSEVFRRRPRTKRNVRDVFEESAISIELRSSTNFQNITPNFYHSISETPDSNRNQQTTIDFSNRNQNTTIDFGNSSTDLDDSNGVFETVNSRSMPAERNDNYDKKDENEDTNEDNKDENGEMYNEIEETYEEKYPRPPEGLYDSEEFKNSQKSTLILMTEDNEEPIITTETTDDKDKFYKRLFDDDDGLSETIDGTNNIDLNKKEVFHEDVEKIQQINKNVTLKKSVNFDVDSDDEIKEELVVSNPHRENTILYLNEEEDDEYPRNTQTFYLNSNSESEEDFEIHQVKHDSSAVSLESYENEDRLEFTKEENVGNIEGMVKDSEEIVSKEHNQDLDSRQLHDKNGNHAKTNGKLANYSQQASSLFFDDSDNDDETCA